MRGLDNIWIFFLSLEVVGALVCPIHKEKVGEGRIGMDSSENSRLFAAFQSGCTACTGYLSKNDVIFGCERGQDQQCQGLLEEEAQCTGTFCCCKRLDCYDRLRELVGVKNKGYGDTTCLVTVLTDKGMLLDSYVRTKCAVCLAKKEEFGKVITCLADADVTRHCWNKTNYIGGHLACDSPGDECCCRASNCTDEFNMMDSQKRPRKPHIRQDAGSHHGSVAKILVSNNPLISSPYLTNFSPSRLPTLVSILTIIIAVIIN